MKCLHASHTFMPMLVLYSVNDAILLDKPVDVVVLQDSPASFNCSTNSIDIYHTGNYITWYNSTSASCVVPPSPCIVYYANYLNTTLFPNKTLSSRYQVTSIDSSTGEHSRNLKIISVRTTDAGQYVCSDITTNTNASAQLAVIGEFTYFV